jgi:transposase
MGVKVNKCLGVRTKFRYGAGIDVHKEYVTACVAIQRQHVIDKLAVQQFQRTPIGLGDMGRFLNKYLLSTVVMESTGVYTPIVKETLEKTTWNGITPEIIVINPSIVKKYPGEIHADRQDAFELARLGLLGLAEYSYLPVKAIKEIRWLSRRMYYLTKDCTRVKNRIKQSLDLWGLSLPYLDFEKEWVLDFCRILIFSAQGNLERVFQLIEQGESELKSSSSTAIMRRKENYQKFFTIHLPHSAIKMIELHLASLNAHYAIIDAIIQLIEGIMELHSELKDKVHQLIDIPGLNEQSGVSLICEIGSIKRFTNLKHYLQYVGCAPTIYQSGTIRKPSHLNKRVNHFAKRIFINAGRSVCSTVKKESDLKEFARKQLNRHWNNKKLAYANTGIKIAKIVYHLLLTGEPYNPFYETNSNKVSKINATEGERHTQIRLTIMRKRTRKYLNYLHSVLESQQDDMVRNIYNEIKEMWKQHFTENNEL